MNLVKKANGKLKTYLKEYRLKGIESQLECIRNLEFSIFSSNCIGMKVYNTAKVAYNTPTIGLFMFAPCYLKFLGNLDYYLKKDLTFIDSSLYKEGNEILTAKGSYPLGRLNDIELHFMHYSSERECRSNWNFRLREIAWENLFIIFTDRDLCTYQHLEQFDQLPFKNKVCFTGTQYDEFTSCIQVKSCREDHSVGDLYNNFDRLYGVFDFGEWIKDESLI